MRKSFGKREWAVFIILSVILLALVYYQLTYRAVENARVKYDTTELEMQIQSEQIKAADIARMKAEIAANKGNETGVVESYDNIKKEIIALNDILADAESFSLSYGDPTVQDSSSSSVRRVISISFVASSYKSARQIINELHDCPYRCLITDISMSIANGQDEDGTFSSSMVAVQLNVTFFETLYNSNTTKGLYIANSDGTSSGENLTDALAADRERAETTGLDDTESTGDETATDVTTYDETQ